MHIFGSDDLQPCSIYSPFLVKILVQTIREFRKVASIVNLFKSLTNYALIPSCCHTKSHMFGKGKRKRWGDGTEWLLDSKSFQAIGSNRRNGWQRSVDRRLIAGSQALRNGCGCLWRPFESVNELLEGFRELVELERCWLEIRPFGLNLVSYSWLCSFLCLRCFLID